MVGYRGETLVPKSHDTDVEAQQKQDLVREVEERFGAANAETCSDLRSMPDAAL